MSIIISQENKNARRIDKSEFENEDYMQQYIHDNPESIPIYEIDEDKKLFVVAREFGTQSGPIDALAIDKDGDIYIVETKLQKNYTRREVIAQALDYGASLWMHGDYGEFRAKIDDGKVKQFFGLDDETLTFLTEAIKNNLQQGNIKFVILMDAVDDRLKDLIVYINQTSRFDIYAVQMEYYEFEKYQIMIPKLFGGEVKKNISTPASGKRPAWDEQSFLDQTNERLGAEANKIIEFYGFFKSRADKIKWGTGNANGSFAPIIKNLSPTISPFSIYSDGTILIKFSWLKNHGDKEAFNKYFNIFFDEMSKTKLKPSKEELLENTYKIKPKDFLENHGDILKVVKAIF